LKVNRLDETKLNIEGKISVQLKVCNKSSVKQSSFSLFGLLKSSTDVLIDIETQPLGWCVERDLKDFEWLFNIIEIKFPSYFVI